MLIEGSVGPTNTNAADGAHVESRFGRTGDQIVTELHGRFFEQNYRNALFGGGMTLTSISNATFTSATTGATATPIVGVWNPLNSTVNLVILQAKLGVTITALQATGAAPFVWMASTNNSAITTGASPYNLRSLAAFGSQGKNMSGAALTGMTGTLAILGASSLGGGSASNAAFLGTQVAMQSSQFSYREDIDGAFIVPPGGVIALMATTTPVAHSAASMLIWEEVPL